MTSPSTDLEPTLADAFDIGRREGIKESLTEIKNLLSSGMSQKDLNIYLEARLKTINDFGLNNPFKQQAGK